MVLHSECAIETGLVRGVVGVSQIFQFGEGFAPLDQHFVSTCNGLCFLLWCYLRGIDLEIQFDALDFAQDEQGLEIIEPK
jgi:hypothetical protein